MSLPPPCLLGLPYDASSSYLRGAAEAPALNRRVLASPAGNSWTEGLVDLRGLQDAGDLALPETPESRALIEAGIAKVLLRPARPLCLGGDHSVTYPVLRALRGAYPGLAILHIDAHPDLYPDFGGDPYSHACPFARIMEEGLASRLVQVGIRAMTPDQKDQAARFGVEVIDMRAWTSGTR